MTVRRPMGQPPPLGAGGLRGCYLFRMTMDLRELADHVAPTLRRYGVVRAGVFGSSARAEARPDSDLDILVEFEPGRTLFDLVDLKDELCSMLGREADVVTYASLHPLIRERVLREEVSIL